MQQLLAAARKRNDSINREPVETLPRHSIKLARWSESKPRRQFVQRLEPDVVPRPGIFATGIAKADDEFHNRRP